MSAEARLQQMGILLPSAPAAKGLYRSVVVVGNWAFTSGLLSINAAGQVITGRLGADMDESAGQEAAQCAGLNLLASLREALGSLDRVCRVVKLTGFVQSAPEFQAQPAVLNGCSRLLAEVFGAEAGVGARSAVGVAALPLNAAVEIDALVEIFT